MSRAKVFPASEAEPAVSGSRRGQDGAWPQGLLKHGILGAAQPPDLFPYLSSSKWGKTCVQLACHQEWVGRGCAGICHGTGRWEGCSHPKAYGDPEGGVGYPDHGILGCTPTLRITEIRETRQSACAVRPAPRGQRWPCLPKLKVHGGVYGHTIHWPWHPVRRLSPRFLLGPRVPCFRSGHGDMWLKSQKAGHSRVGTPGFSSLQEGK